MTTRPIRPTPMMHLNSPRPTPDNTDPLNHTHHHPLPTMCPTTHLNPTITRPTVLPLMLSNIPRRLSGTVKAGPTSVSLWHHRRPSKKHRHSLLPVDRNLPPLPRLPQRLHLHPPPRPLHAYMLLLPPHSRNPQTPKCGEPLERPRAQTHLPNPSASRGRKKLPPLGTRHHWRPHHWHQPRWILISERHVFSFISTCELIVLMNL
jgi:hypothetical protein